MPLTDIPAESESDWVTDINGKEYAVCYYPGNSMWIIAGVGWVALNDRFGIWETTVK
jgi:hypothetical protein